MSEEMDNYDRFILLILLDKLQQLDPELKVSYAFPRVLSEDERVELTQYLCDKFGVPSV